MCNVFTCSCVELNSHSHLQLSLFVETIVMKFIYLFIFQGERPLWGNIDNYLQKKGKNFLTKENNAPGFIMPSCQNLLRYKDLQMCVIFLPKTLNVCTKADYSPLSSEDDSDNIE